MEVKDTGYRTGYFADTHRGTFVHIVLAGKPICGYKPNKKYSFRQCSYGITIDYVECKKCKEKGLKLLSLKEA